MRKADHIMAPTPITAAATGATDSSLHALWESLIGVVTRSVNEQLTGLTSRLSGALLDVEDMAGDAYVVHQRFKAGSLLKSNSYAFIHLVSTEVERCVRAEIALLTPSSMPLRRDADHSLSLVPYSEMDSKVIFSGISRPFETDQAERLATLNVRLGYMLERDVLRIGQNPFRPEVLLQATNQAWCQFEPDEASHPMLLSLLRPNLFLDLGPMYEALNLALVRKGVLAGGIDNYRIRKTDPATAAPARAAKQAELAQQLRHFFGSEVAQMPDLGIPMIPDLPGLGGAQHAPWQSGGRDGGGSHGAGYSGSAGGSYGAGASAGGYGTGSAAGGRYQGGAAQGGGYGAGGPGAEAMGRQDGGHGGAAQGRRQLMSFLAAMQQATPMAGAPAAAGANASNVFHLPKIKDSVPEGSLSRHDEGTIDLLSKIFDTVFHDQSIPEEIRELIRFLQIPVLKAALVDKDFFFQEAHPARRMIDLLSRMGWEQRKGADDPLFQAMQRNVTRVGRETEHELAVFVEAVADLEESIKVEEKVATEAIAEPIAVALKQEKMAEASSSARHALGLRLSSGGVVSVVESFLENKWKSVLTIAYSVETEKPGAVENATRTMDDLIWSVQPKITQAQRRALISRLPTLLAGLNTWLDIIKWQDAARLQFFAELAECHASIVRAPLELSPERQLEIAVEVAQKDAERRIALELAPPPPRPPEVAGEVLDTLQRGMWLEFTDAETGSRKVKLAWISPLRTLFIFSTGARQEAFSMSSEKLGAAFQAEQARLIRIDDVVGVALSDALAAAAVNDTDAHTAACA